MEIKFVSAVIMVKDIPASRHFYEDFLGQKVLMDHGLNVGYEGGFAIWQKDFALQVIFNRIVPEENNHSSHAMEIYFETENLEEIQKVFTAAGVEFVHNLIEQPWGQRVLRVYDPDRTIVEVGEPMSAVIIRMLLSGFKAEEISKRTSMPLEIVQQIAAAVDKG
jgi:catechol 2,3-dioxygenase-like lactoylglutathione lyase family enzyme